MLTFPTNIADITAANKDAVEAVYESQFNELKTNLKNASTMTYALYGMADDVSSATGSQESTLKSIMPAIEEPRTNLIRRQYEVNEWTANNKLDTLFVLQMTFVGICVCAIMTGLYRMHIIGGGFYGVISGIVLLILIFTVVRRAQYTKYTRDQRYWNRQRFDRAPAPPITLPSVTCTTSGL
jgi:hypothetical protein